MKSKGNILLIVLLLIALAATGIVGYLYWLNYSLTFEECVKIPGSSIDDAYPSHCTAPDGRRTTQVISQEEKQKRQQQLEAIHKQNDSSDTANWNTYVNSEKSYQVKYPNDWEVSEQYSYVNFRRKDDETPTISGFSIEVFNNPNNLSIRKFCGGDTSESFLCVDYEFIITSEEIGGIKWDHIEPNTVSLPPAGYIPFSKSLSGQLYFVNIHNTDETQAKRILSTFRFTDNLLIISPKEKSIISSPVTVEGTVPAGWMFEGVFPIKITDLNGKVLGQGQGEEKTPGNWMSGKSTEFRSSISFTKTAPSGYIVLMKDNPSGLPENDDQYKIMISF